MAGVVLKHGGTLDKFIGDAVLVFFGDPETKGIAEDAETCVRMALEMREAIAELNREWLAKRDQARLRGADGHLDRVLDGRQFRQRRAHGLYDYREAGEPCQPVASCGAARGDLIGQETWLLVRDVFLCVAKEPVQVKGFERPIQTYAVTGAALPEGPGLIEDARPGFRLTLDPAQVGATERIAVVEKLRAAIASLR